MVSSEYITVSLLPDPIQPHHGAAGHLRFPARPDQGCPQRPAGHPVERPGQGASGPGSAAAQPAGAQPGAGEGGAAPAGALPPAYQPGAAGVRLSGVCHAPGDPLHGRSRE